jgi:hypothetical protein
MIGEFSGALVHFGFRVIGHNPEIRTGTQLLFSFLLEVFGGTWEFSTSAPETVRTLVDHKLCEM